MTDQGVPLQVAESLPVIPFEIPVRIRLGVGEQSMKPAQLAGVPRLLHQVDARRIPLPPHPVLGRSCAVGFFIGLGLRRFGHRPLLGLAVQSQFGLDVTHRGDRGDRGEQDENRRRQPGRERIPAAPSPAAFHRRGSARQAGAAVEKSL